jgi:glycosyltransferase involved in cell wall biosynthesis
MRILFCNYEYPPLGGGGGVVMAALATELARRHDVTVLTSRAGRLPDDAVEQGVRVVRVPVLFRRELAVANFPSLLAYLPNAFWRGLRLGREHAFDVINTHFVVPTGPVGDWLSRALSIPNVLSVHGGDLFDPSKFMSPHRHRLLRLAIARLLRRADTVVGQSRDTVGHVATIYDVHRPVELIPLGIVRPQCAVAGSRAQFGIPETAVVMVSVGRVVPRKATPQLMRVLAAADARDLYLILVGDGPDLAAVRRLATELGVSDRVRLLGHVSEQHKYQALSISDLFVSTSQHEGFGLVYLEAMAFGLPIVCYDRGGQTDFLATPTTGRVVLLNDMEAFTRAVMDLYRSREMRAAISRHNLVRVEDFFIERCAERYEVLFENTLRADRRAVRRARR